MTKEHIIFLTIVLLIIVIGIIKYFISDDKRKEKNEIFKELEHFKTEILDILDQICYESVDKISEFKNLEEFTNYILLTADEKFKKLIKSSFEDNLRELSFEIDDQIIDSYIDKIIEDSKYITIIESIYDKALEDDNKAKLTEVSKPEKFSNETNITNEIENYYNV